MRSHAGTCAHLLDEAHAAQVHVVAGAGVEHLLAVDGARADEGVVDQLRRAPDEGQELVVIQPPHTVRPGRLQPVGESTSTA
jgi:hypothetical protein